jgi:EmrB/QacA subfamily drug resistance transporter
MVAMDRKWKILLLVSVGSFMAFLDAPIVTIAFPALQEEFRTTSPSTLSWILDAYFLGFAAFLVVGGKLADRYGRRRLFMGGLATFTLASIACGAAPSAGFLIGARVVQCISAAMVVPAGQALLLAAFPKQDRKTAIGALAGIIGLATAIAPAVGGAIIEASSWRWIFYVNVLGGVAALAYGARLLDAKADERDPRAPLPDFLGALLQAASVGLIVLALLKRGEWGTGDARTIGSFALGLALLPAFLLRSRSHPSPVIELPLFRSRTFTAANVTSFLFAIGFYAATITSVLFMTRFWHYSTLQTGAALTPGAILGTIVAAPAGIVAERRGPRGVAVFGSLLGAIGMVLILTTTDEHPNYLAHWLPGSLLFGAGAVMALTALVGAAVTSVPDESFGIGSGINAAMRQIGAAVGVAIVIAIIAGTGSGTPLDHIHDAFLVTIVGFLAAAVSALALGQPEKDQAAVPSQTEPPTTAPAPEPEPESAVR